MGSGPPCSGADTPTGILIGAAGAGVGRHQFVADEIDGELVAAVTADDSAPPLDDPVPPVGADRVAPRGSGQAAPGARAAAARGAARADGRVAPRVKPDRRRHAAVWVRASREGSVMPSAPERGGASVRLDVVPARSFEGSSRVSAYWLANCEGFSVRRGRRRGVVVDVALDAARQRTEYLVVRFGLRRSVVEIGDVAVVVPAHELLVLRPPERRIPRVAPAARRVRDAGGRAAWSGGRLSVRGARTTARASVRLGAAAARETRTLARWLAPRLACAAREVERAVAAGAVLAALALAAAARLLSALGSAVAASLRARWSGAGTDGRPPPVVDEDREAPEPGRARQHAA
jgi:hypothetical protein